MRISEAPRCVPFDDFVVRGDRAEACITAMLGISSEEFLILWFDLGCEYANVVAGHTESRVTAHQLIKNNLFWNYWIERWIDTCDYFIEWNNPDKSMGDFKECQIDGMPPLKVFNMLQITSQNNEKTPGKQNVAAPHLCS